MKNLLYIILLGLSLSIASCSGGQNDSDSDNEKTIAEESNQEGISQAAKDAFENKYPSQSDAKWNVDDHGNMEADFKMDGEKYRADFDKSGNWIETENSIKFDDLPEVVQEVIKKDYDKDDISEIEAVDNSKKGKFFDVEFKHKGKNRDVEINEQGEVIN